MFFDQIFFVPCVFLLPASQHIVLNPKKRYEYIYSLSSYGQIVGLARLFNLGMVTGLGEEKLTSNLVNSA